MTDLKRTEQPDLTWDEAMGLADKVATDAARLRGDKRLTASLWPTKSAPVRERPFWWRWVVVEQNDHDAVLATGHRLTERGAWLRGGKAARQIRDERAEATKAEADHG